MEMKPLHLLLTNLLQIFFVLSHWFRTRFLFRKHEDHDLQEHSRLDLERGTSGKVSPVMERPVCFIENHEDGTMQVNQAALEILSRVTQKVVVVAIVGKYRTGKSYLMNKLARRKNGFALGSTVQSMTKGIWMWCVPHPVTPEHTLVLLDTEGLGDVERVP
ncbi:guanylate-binding protein 6-like [Leptodactylus fuscus]|uniref:guanylate-binding protein 6-like n=1 Tax=Leptodactylus fuscus TaxID=238119 RepID=UPI003F4EC0B1